MAYNDFTLAGLRQQFGLQIREESDLFSSVAPVAISGLLQQTLQENVPLALDISTEKARSEFIIAPTLMEVRRQLGNRVSLFSGYGAVTTGSIWRFLRLTETIVTVDTGEYYIKEVERIVAVLVMMLQEP